MSLTGFHLLVPRCSFNCYVSYKCNCSWLKNFSISAANLSQWYDKFWCYDSKRRTKKLTLLKIDGNIHVQDIALVQVPVCLTINLQGSQFDKTVSTFLLSGISWPSTMVWLHAWLEFKLHIQKENPPELNKKRNYSLRVGQFKSTPWYNTIQVSLFTCGPTLWQNIWISAIICCNTVANWQTLQKLKINGL